MSDKPMICEHCVLWDDWLERGKCYGDLDYHAPDDTCAFWAGSLRDEPLDDPPEKKLIKAVAQLDTGIGEED